LERRGMLERTHGGAGATQWMRAEPAYLEAASANPAEKRLSRSVRGDPCRSKNGSPMPEYS
jgi:DeoR/GlpR family transcriptional regulator of sugar metabolism